ncbi:MAG: putative 4-hydroxybenzoate polyprenyltransferase [Bacteroidales bacterium]|jgi:4-hydroxybenzoate polyprenyltransferase|nr:putative 4-hydroxybenzoate polyprenyltransferase [Bacteroidales bacterium]
MLKYLSLVKFSHTIFAMPFAILGFVIAICNNGSFHYMSLLYVVLCMIFARNAAMGFNRYLDRDIDSRNVRTEKREIPSGLISGKRALVFVIVNSILFCATTLLINTLVFYLSFVALFVVLGYSYTKRFTYLCHYVLGIGLGLAPVGSYLTVNPSFDLVPVLLGFAVATWVAGFDIIYALQDADFDRDNSLHSVPAKFGAKRALLISRFSHIISVLIIWYSAYMSGTGVLYYIGAGVYSLLIIYQHSIVKYNDLSRINVAFFTTNGVVSILFSILAISAYLL